MSQCLIKHSYQPLLNYRKWINDWLRIISFSIT
jgi:hypothetical protein